MDGDTYSQVPNDEEQRKKDAQRHEALQRLAEVILWRSLSPESRKVLVETRREAQKRVTSIVQRGGHLHSVERKGGSTMSEVPSTREEPARCASSEEPGPLAQAREERIKQFTELDDDDQRYALLLVDLIGTGPELSEDASEYLLHLAKVALNKKIVWALHTAARSAIERRHRRFAAFDEWIEHFTLTAKHPVKWGWADYEQFLVETIEYSKEALEINIDWLQEHPDSLETVELIEQLQQRIAEREETLARLQRVNGAS